MLVWSERAATPSQPDSQEQLDVLATAGRGVPRVGTICCNKLPCATLTYFLLVHPNIYIYIIWKL